MQGKNKNIKYILSLDNTHNLDIDLRKIFEADFTFTTPTL